MKTVMTIVVALLVVAGHARADALKDTLRGGLLGAAAGALVSELSDDYDARYTIPFFTGIGALTGYAVHENRHPRGRRYGTTRRHAYYLPYMALPYAWYHHRYPATRDYRATPPRAASKQPPRKTQPETIDRHPGVTMVPVPITLRNGTVIPIHLFKVGDHYTGPQGESYETLPDTETLRRHYAP